MQEMRPGALAASVTAALAWTLAIAAPGGGPGLLAAAGAAAAAFLLTIRLMGRSGAAPFDLLCLAASAPQAFVRSSRAARAAVGARASLNPDVVRVVVRGDPGAAADHAGLAGQVVVSVDEGGFFAHELSGDAPARPTEPR